MKRIYSKKSFLLFTLLTLIFSACSSDTNTTDVNENNQSNETSSNEYLLGSLSIGDKVVDSSWEWSYKNGYGYSDFNASVTQSVTWIVVAKDHYGSSVTLLSEKLIAYFSYDESTIDSGLLAGRNHWGNSGSTSLVGLRPWLNSEAPHEGTGFYNAFSDNFKSALVVTSLSNYDFDTMTNYTTDDLVFIPSNTELGDTVHDSTFEIGSTWEYFLGSEDSLRVTNFPDQSYGEEYWTRSPVNYGYRTEAVVYDSGFFASNFADFNSVGVRPAVNLNSNTKVSVTVNEDGYYEILY